MLKKINAGFFFPVVAVVLLVLLLDNQMFGVSPLGKLLNPFRGVASNSADYRLNRHSVNIAKPGLNGQVQVYFDGRKVPHIFAGSTADMYFAQGYVTASLRLWQMEFTAYVAAGRLNEIFAGPEFLDMDRNQRRAGVTEAARTSLQLMEKDPETIAALNAYTAGVNAFIEELDYAAMPPEYKLLDYKPEPWTNLKSVLIQKNVAVNMTGYGEDLLMTRLLLALGREKFNMLYPDVSPLSAPVVGTGQEQVSKAFSTEQPVDYLAYSFLSASPVLPVESYNPRLGSNSWAVSGKKSKSGYPVLASDPHLNLTLPCIWLEMQLSSPGSNAYGVTIPGTPAIIIGFNGQVAWGITNGSDDVKDWYKLKLSPDLKKYELDGKWLNLDMRVETIKRKGQTPFPDTVYSTVHGPIMTGKTFPGQEADLQYNALRWEIQRPSNEFRTFIRLNRARNYDDYRDAIRTYNCPLQNFTFACSDNTIAINHQGGLPVKWPGQGKFILDGSRGDHLPVRYIPFDSLPQLVNPANGFVFSANQQPTSGAYNYYYNGYFAEARAAHISQVLAKDTLFDMAAMQAMQLDNSSFIAVKALPVLLAATRQKAIPAQLQPMLNNLLQWNGSYDAGSEQALLFELWWKHLNRAVWDELSNLKFYTQSPDDIILLNMLLNDTANIFFDKLGTLQKETAADIAAEAFGMAVNEYGNFKKEHGDVRWGAINQVSLQHLTNIAAFSRTGINSGGHPNALNALQGGWGPSWRMVVELGPRPKAVGIYPGGQSGNPGSRYYDNFVDDWNRGKYYTLNYYLTNTEAAAAAGSTWTMNKK